MFSQNNNNNSTSATSLFSPNSTATTPTSPSMSLNSFPTQQQFSQHINHHQQHSPTPTLPPLNSFHTYSAGVMQNFDGFNVSTPYGSPSFSLPTTPTSTYGLGNQSLGSPLSNILHSPSVTSPQQQQLNNNGSGVMLNKPSTSAFGKISTVPTASEIVSNFIVDQVSKITNRDEYEPISQENLISIRKSKMTSPSNDSKNKNQSTSEDEEYDEDGSDSAPKNKSDKKKNHHPIACVQCRQLHKKCDKKLPSCSKCISRGVECTYNTPRKRGKVSRKDNENKADVNNNNNNNNNGISMPQSTMPPFMRTEKPNNHLPASTVIDSYFAVLCGGHPAIEKKKLEYVVQNNYSYINSLLVTNDYNVRLPIPEGENPERSFILAFYLSIQALSEQRYGLLELADESHRHAEKEVARLIDHFTNFYIVACYINMALYESGCGNYKKARFYLNNVNFYFEDEENQNKDLNFYEQNLKKFRVFVVGSCHSDIDNIGSMGTFVEMMPRMFKLASGGQDMQLPPECWQVFNSRNVTADNYMLFMQIMDMVAKAFEKYRAILYGMAVDFHSPTFFKFQDLQRAFINNGIKFLLLEKVVSVASNFAEETALKITLLTEHELFPYSALGVMLGIINTCKFHLNIVKQIESGMRPALSTIISSATNKAITVDYFSILQKDLRALQVLSKRYKRITLYHGQMMEEMEKIIQRKQNIDPFHSALQIQSLNQAVPPMQSGTGTDNPNDVLLSTILGYLKKAIESNQNPPPLPFTANISPMNDVRSDFGFPWEL